MARPNALTSVTRGLAWILAGVFLIAAAVKLAGIDAVAEAFTDWGYPVGTHYVVAALELAVGLLLLVPVSARLGATLGMAVMGGALATHLSTGAYGVAGLPVLIGVALMWVVAAEPSAPGDALDDRGAVEA